jgi:hypothetical protein
MVIYHMPHYDREHTSEKNFIQINIMKFDKKKHSSAQYFLTVYKYLYSKLARVLSQVYWISFSDVVCLEFWHICMWNILKNLRNAALTPVNKLHPLGFFLKCLIWSYSDTFCITIFGATAVPLSCTEFGKCLIKVITGTLNVLFI